MRIDNPSREQLAHCFAVLDKRAARAGKPDVKYLDLGPRIVRLINHSAAFTPHVERQLTWVLKDEAPRYDATLVIWQEKNFADAALALGQFTPAQYRKLRVQKLARPDNPGIPGTIIFDENIVRHHPLVNVNTGSGVLSAWSPETNIYYYSVANLDAEEFIKRGHIFVHTFSKLLKSPTSELVHGAVVGLDGKGVLFCGIGYRGKSTLAVSALLDGFEYVSDDYLTLSKEGNPLRAWPIYSIITLAPEMYGKMYHTLRGQFVSNNARKDKYVFNIAAHHDRFVSGYPVTLCIYPRITSNPEPSIVPGDKAIAIEEFVFSTVNQTGDAKDVATIAKLHAFVDDLPFYRMNLSPDIDKNTQCLREFLEGLE